MIQYYVLRFALPLLLLIIPKLKIRQVHKLMLRDAPRTNAYREAINSQSKDWIQGKAVLGTLQRHHKCDIGILVAGLFQTSVLALASFPSFAGRLVLAWCTLLRPAPWPSRSRKS